PPMRPGGAAMDAPRHIWWNFVSSRKERIEQAKADWKAARFDSVPGDDKEFIPLPEGGSAPSEPPEPERAAISCPGITQSSRALRDGVRAPHAAIDFAQAIERPAV